LAQRFERGTGEVFERRPLELAIALLGVQLDERSGLGERNKRDVERSLLSRDDVAGGKCPLEPCSGMSLRGHEHTFSQVECGDHEDMSAAAI